MTVFIIMIFGLYLVSSLATLIIYLNEIDKGNLRDVIIKGIIFIALILSELVLIKWLLNTAL